MKIMRSLSVILAVMALCFFRIGSINAAAPRKAQEQLSDPRYAWMDAVVEQEFAAYRESGITREMIDATEQSTEAGWRWVRYRVVKQKIYGPPGPVFQTLDYLRKLYRLPDLDFVYLEGDGITGPVSFPGPALCSAKRKDLPNAVMLHGWYFFIYGSPRGPQFDWIPIAKEIEQLSREIPWEQKASKAFWRGWAMDFGGHSYWTKENWREIPRGRAVYLSHLFPDLLDAGFTTGNALWQQELCQRLQTDIVLIKTHTSHAEHLRYKYQLCIDGVTCTSPGYEWRLLSNCCVFKQETDQVMWFYSQLVPWVHYVPLRADLSDLVEKLQWAREHDTEAKAIAENGQRFARENLMPREIMLYAYKVLLKYASLQRFQPTSS